MWACGILTRCQENPGKCKPADLLLRVVPNWGYVTCLTLAESAENLTFLSHPVVTDLLADKWHGLVIGDNLIPSGYFGRILAPTMVINLLIRRENNSFELKEEKQAKSYFKTCLQK